MNDALAAQPLYSPLLPIKYSRRCHDTDILTGIGPELVAAEDRAVWNLYWLSDPLVDLYITDIEQHDCDLEILRACFKAVDQKINDRLVSDLVTTLPAPKFAEVLTAEKLEHLVPYAMRGRLWLDTVLSRCGQYRGTVRDEGNVRYANFGQRANVTKPDATGMIMTLALPKS